MCPGCCYCWGEVVLRLLAVAMSRLAMAFSSWSFLICMQCSEITEVRNGGGKRILMSEKGVHGVGVGGCGCACVSVCVCVLMRVWRIWRREL